MHHKSPANFDWGGLWKLALWNMPSRTRVVHDFSWLPALRRIPIAEFIKEQAHGRMCLEDGKVMVLTKVYYYEEYGQQAALTKALGLHKPRCTAHCFCHQRVKKGIMQGTIPQDKRITELLFKLADSKNGPKLAKKLLKKHGKH